MPVVIALPLEMSVEHRGELEVMARSDSLPYRQVRQASALVMAADGVANGAIARAVGVKADTVRRGGFGSPPTVSRRWVGCVRGGAQAGDSR